ncbi:MAG: hypothetical protein Q8N69_01555, partial [bacterium]|nr:hypothetical protein [bacterium]
LRVYGYITATSGASFAALNLDDTNDEFLIDVSDGDADTTLDAAIRLDDTAGSSMFRIRDSGGDEIFAVDSNGIVKMLYVTSDSGLDANGEIMIGNVGGSNRIYFYSNSGTHYVNATAGFEVPAWETNDPITGEPIDIGDFVLGTIDSRYNDGAMHGLWTRWDTVKTGLIGEIYANLGIDETGSIMSTSTDQNFETAVFADASASQGGIAGWFERKLKGALEAIGMFIDNGIVAVTGLFAEKVTTKELCVGETCIDEQQLKELLNKSSFTPSESEGLPDTEQNAGDGLPEQPADANGSGVVIHYCDEGYAELCTTPETCQDAGLYWYENDCHSEEKSEILNPNSETNINAETPNSQTEEPPASVSPEADSGEAMEDPAVESPVAEPVLQVESGQESETIQ